MNPSYPRPSGKSATRWLKKEKKNILELLLHYFKMWQLKKASQAAESSFHGTGDFKGFRLVCESVSQSA